MNDCRLPVNILVGMAMIGLDLPGFAAPQSAPVFVSQVACKVSRNMIAVYETAKSDEEVVGTLRRGTLVGLVRPLSMSSTSRVEIDQPMIGFVSRAALDCGGQSPPAGPSKPTACRRVRNTLNPINVFQKPSWGAQWISQVSANQSVYVLQTGSVTNTTQDSDGQEWVAIDLQRTFGRNFGLSPSVGWLPAIDPGDQQSSTLVYGCN